jgi:hypothetical protein
MATRDTIRGELVRDDASRYLLHEMSDEERAAFDERLLADEELVGLVEAAEDDLFDAYARGELPEARRRRFEELLLRTPEDRARVGVARLLAEKGRAAHPAAPSRSFWGWLRSPRLVLGFAGVAVAGAALALVLTRGDGQPRLPATQVVSLAAATRGDGVPEVPRPDGAVTVRLVAAVDGEYTSFELELHRGAHRIVGPRAAATPALDVPALVLVAGPHELHVSGTLADGRTVPVGVYPFVIR